MSISGHAVVDLLRVVPSHVVRTNRGAVTLEWEPIVWRILFWASLRMTRTMRLSAVQVASAQGMEDSATAGMVCTHW